jgi:class 3 adenylate cyclase
MARPIELAMQERYLALVLLDIIGSTAFVQKVGAKRAAEWFQYHDSLARSLCYKFSGREIDRSDGFLLSFDRISDAVNFALFYQKTIPPKTRLQTRIGVHWGVIVEVTQDERFVGVGAKRVELEGIAKNIAARTMSLCQAGQVLLTKEAMERVRKRPDPFTPKSTRYACVGVYKFKGVKEAQEIYAVGETIESLQPPKGSEKVKRLGGPKYIRKRARDRKFMDWVVWLYWRLGFLSILFWLYVLAKVLANPYARNLILGLPIYMPLLDGSLEFLDDLWRTLVIKK